MKLSYSYSCEVRVRYGETDQMGYCYYGNYAQYFEVGRVETLRNIGMSYKEIEVSGVMLPVAEFNVKYIKPAYYDDLLTVKTILVELRGALFAFEYELTNSEGELIAKAKTDLIFVDKKSMKPIKPPQKLMEIVQKYIL